MLLRRLLAVFVSFAALAAQAQGYPTKPVKLIVGFEPGGNTDTVARVVAQKLSERFADKGREQDIGELKIKISGCINACGHHHVGHIGILGVDKKGEEFYQVTLGGSGEEDASLGAMLGPALPADKVTDAVEQIVEVYLRERKDGERFLDTFRRTGVAPFKEAVYADAH